MKAPAVRKHPGAMATGALPPMTTPDTTRATSSPEPDPAPELSDLAEPRATTTTHAEDCCCPRCLWDRLGAEERRDIRHAIDRRQHEQRSGEERRQYSRLSSKDRC